MQSFGDATRLEGIDVKEAKEAKHEIDTRTGGAFEVDEECFAENHGKLGMNVENVG